MKNNSALLYFIKDGLPETPALNIDVSIEDGIYSAGISGSFTDENGLKELWKDLLFPMILPIIPTSRQTAQSSMDITI